VPEPSLPQYCNCGKPMNWYYVSFVKEIPSRVKAKCQMMASLSEEGHPDGNKMLAHEQHE